MMRQVAAPAEDARFPRCGSSTARRLAAADAVSARRLRLHGRGEEVAIQQHELQRDRRRGERQHGRRALAPRRSRVFAVEQRAHLRGEPGDVARGTDEPGVVLEQELGGAGFRAGHDGKLAGHRLQRAIRARDRRASAARTRRRRRSTLADRCRDRRSSPARRRRRPAQARDSAPRGERARR